MDKYSIFHLEGGLGKHVAATAVAKCIKNNHPDRKLIIVCAYPEIFLNLNFVDRVYKIGLTPYFYQDYIKGKDTLIFKHEPYFTTGHIVDEKPLIENWCELHNLKYNHEQPELVFNLRQHEIALGSRWRREKPTLILHTNGGYINNPPPYAYSWTRDMPYTTAKELIEYYSKDYHILQVCRDKSNVFPGVEPVLDPMPNMELFGMLLTSSKRILIDSSLQHAAAALNLPSTVLWIGTSPSIFGYDIHNNLRAHPAEDIKLPDSYLFDYSFDGVIHECPYMDNNIFDTSEIILNTD